MAMAEMLAEVSWLTASSPPHAAAEEEPLVNQVGSIEHKSLKFSSVDFPNPLSLLLFPKNSIQEINKNQKLSRTPKITKKKKSHFSNTLKVKEILLKQIH
ncbi:hypothetical protein ACH5RR_018078 [Cinchona calisaya]|uniref:Uncharacterized protein n=1 Tax=Cinchona calisaya TaxID=153742 RepID=A0ABD2ZKE3_9GENT